MAGINEIPLWNSPQIFQIFPKYSFFVDNKNNNNNITIIIIIIIVVVVQIIYPAKMDYLYWLLLYVLT